MAGIEPSNRWSCFLIIQAVRRYLSWTLNHPRNRKFRDGQFIWWTERNWEDYHEIGAQSHTCGFTGLLHTATTSLTTAFEYDFGINSSTPTCYLSHLGPGLCYLWEKRVMNYCHYPRQSKPWLSGYHLVENSQRITYKTVYTISPFAPLRWVKRRCTCRLCTTICLNA